MNLFKFKYAPVIFLFILFGVVALPFLNPGPTTEMVAHLVPEANTERDVTVESVEILEHGDKICDNTWVFRPCIWPFKVVKSFDPGNGEAIQLVHRKTVEIFSDTRLNRACHGCYTGLASGIH